MVPLSLCTHYNSISSIVDVSSLLLITLLVDIESELPSTVEELRVKAEAVDNEIKSLQQKIENERDKQSNWKVILHRQSIHQSIYQSIHLI